jgi:hypothetical protein
MTNYIQKYYKYKYKYNLLYSYIHIFGTYIKNICKFKNNINYIPYIYKLNNYKFTTYSVNIINNYNKDVDFEISKDKIDEIIDIVNKILLEKDKYVFLQLQSLFTVNLHLFCYDDNSMKYTIYIYDSYINNPKHYQQYIDIYNKKNINIIHESLPPIYMLEKYNNLLSGKKYNLITEYIDDMLILLFEKKNIYYHILTNNKESIKKYNSEIVIPYLLLFMVYDNKMLEIILEKINNKIFIMEQKYFINYNDIPEFININKNININKINNKFTFFGTKYIK